MRSGAFILFFSIFLSIYGLLNYYVYSWGLRLIPAIPRVRIGYTVLFIIVALSFIAGRFLERNDFCRISTVMEWIGSFWFGALVYFFLAFLLYDLFRLVAHFLPALHSSALQESASLKRLVALFPPVVVTVLLIAGYFNALNLRVRTLDITIPKKAGNLKSLNLVMASDIHLGVIVGKKRFDRLVDRINSLNPDLVLLPGDILDEDIAPVIRENLGDALKRIRSPMGLFACTGNHEYIGGIVEADRYLRGHGIALLRDESRVVGGAFTLAARDDVSGKSFTGVKRKALADILAGVDKSLPLILMDHQPLKLQAAVDNGVDLQLSGHTHHGQFWPINLITDLIYEKSYGYLQKGNTHFYVSSGAGTWGPPIRIYASPEVVQILLKFN